MEETPTPLAMEKEQVPPEHDLLANPRAAWDSVFLPGMGPLTYEFWLAWHFACLIPDKEKP